MERVSGQRSDRDEIDTQLFAIDVAGGFEFDPRAVKFNGAAQAVNAKVCVPNGATRDRVSQSYKRLLSDQPLARVGESNINAH
jgi:hypothetical protein